MTEYGVECGAPRNDVLQRITLAMMDFFKFGMRATKTHTTAGGEMYD